MKYFLVIALLAMRTISFGKCTSWEDSDEISNNQSLLPFAVDKVVIITISCEAEGYSKRNGLDNAWDEVTTEFQRHYSSPRWKGRDYQSKPRSSDCRANSEGFVCKNTSDFILNLSRGNLDTSPPSSTRDAPQNKENIFYIGYNKLLSLGGGKASGSLYLGGSFDYLITPKCFQQYCGKEEFRFLSFDTGVSLSKENSSIKLSLIPSIGFGFYSKELTYDLEPSEGYEGDYLNYDPPYDSEVASFGYKLEVTLFLKLKTLGNLETTPGFFIKTIKHSNLDNPRFLLGLNLSW